MSPVSLSKVERIGQVQIQRARRASLLQPGCQLQEQLLLGHDRAFADWRLRHALNRRATAAWSANTSSSSIVSASSSRSTRPDGYAT